MTVVVNSQHLMYRLRFQSYKVLTNVGTFFYHKRNNESLFFPLDSFLFFKSLEEGANKKTTHQRIGKRVRIN